MEIICHRRNSIEELIETSTSYGVEVDIRTNGNDLIINHDPLKDGILFKEWIKNYNHGTLILNVKEEGLEEPILNLMKIHDIKNYFFLDQSFPFLIKCAQMVEKKAAVRVSEYEAVQTAINLSGIVDWVWLDCFSNFPISIEDFRLIRNCGFKVCLVSPELQGRNSDVELNQLIDFIISNQLDLNAVCTKKPKLWESRF